MIALGIFLVFVSGFITGFTMAKRLTGGKG